MLDNLTDEQLDAIKNGDFYDNNELDTACATRILRLCEDFGKDGEDAEKLLLLALDKLDIYVG